MATVVSLDAAISADHHDVGDGVVQQRKDKLSNYFRARRFPMIEAMIADIHAKKGSCRIIDVGGRQEYWAPILPALSKYNAHITVINLEQTQPQGAKHFAFEFGNACKLDSHADNSFDLAHSNSLLEHVGTWRDMRNAANEMRRVAPAYYVQTPYFWFPLEPHFRVPFYHWLPEQLRYRLIMQSKLGYIGKADSVDDAMERVQSACLLDKRQMVSLFPDSAVSFEKVLGLPKSLIARRG
jgi:Methyltransferase domain